MLTLRDINSIVIFFYAKNWCYDDFISEKAQEAEQGQADNLNHDWDYIYSDKKGLTIPALVIEYMKAVIGKSSAAEIEELLEFKTVRQ